MDENLAKKLAVISLICGSLVYVITIYTSIEMAANMWSNFDFNQPENMDDGFSSAFNHYFETLDMFKIPIIILCSIAIITGVGGLKSPKKQKGMAIAGIILGVMYLLVHLFLLGFYRNFIERMQF